MVVALIVAACGGDPAPGAEVEETRASSSTSLAEALSPERIEPVPQEASRLPEPVAEPVLTPVPTPAIGPTKPNRGVPTPPPPRFVPVEGGPTDAMIQLAVADLASRLGVPEFTVDVLDARWVTWRDGAVGCPQPGVAYSQAEVPGALIVLRVGESSYRYHAADTGPLVYCETPQAPVEGGA